MGRANGEGSEQTGGNPLKQILLDLEADASSLARLASKAEEQARDARRQADLARERVERLRREIFGSDALENAAEPTEGLDVLSSEPGQVAPNEKTISDLLEKTFSDLLQGTISDLFEETIRTIAQPAMLRASLGKFALIPYAECLEAAGISRDVGDRLREEGELEPIVIAESKNPRLYISVGAWRAFVKRRKLALPPSKSKLSKAKRKTKAK